MRADMKFKNLVREIRIQRLQQGIDKEPLSERRITKAISNLPNIKDIVSGSRIDRER